MIRRLLHRLRVHVPAPTPSGSGEPRAPTADPPRRRPDRAAPPAYLPTHPEAWTLDGAFHPDFLAAAGDPDRLAALARPVHPGLWALPVLAPAWCEAHRAEVAAYER